MDFLNNCVDVLLHLDVYLESWMRQYQLASYLILAAIVFCETGLVIAPFLPGDSLLFAAGAITAKTGILDIWLLMLILMAASLVGDNLNYFFGRFIGTRVFEREFWFIRRSHLQRTREFYIRHGGKAVVLARFVPILRTVAPFVAGVGAMKYRRFIGFSALASLLWVPIFALSGFYFGQIPFVQENFHWIVVAIIAISFAPIGIELWRHRLRKEHASESVTNSRVD